MERNTTTLLYKVRRLENNVVQKNLLDIMLRKHKIQTARLDAIDGCLPDIVQNEAANMKRKTTSDSARG